jgi:plastocyanin
VKLRRSVGLGAALTLVLGACTPAISAEPPTVTDRTGLETSGAAPTIAVPTDAAGRPVVFVWMGEHYYSPASLTIPVGTTVMWRMLGAQEHDVWAYDGSFHSPTMGPGDTYSHTFTKAGTFKYFCVPHYGDGMAGEVIVK